MCNHSIAMKQRRRRGDVASTTGEALLELTVKAIIPLPEEGCGIAFAFGPGYHKAEGELFEPYALRTDSGILHRIMRAEFRLNFSAKTKKSQPYTL